jgi:putative tryptophan/tyrosine transport system substrate-binding protein
MRRREFITMVGSAATWPLAARAQQAERVRRIGFLSTTNENNQLARAQTTLLEALTKLGWVEGRNLRIDLRGAADRDRLREYAAELVKLSPDVIVTSGVAPTMAAQQETRTIPIVVSGVGDPLAVGLVKSIARPEGNITGVTNAVFSIGSKWLELLKEAAPRVNRVALLQNARLLANPNAEIGYYPSIEEAARVLAVKVIRISYRDAVEIVHGIEAFAAEPNGGLIVMPPPPTITDRQLILRLAAQHQLPAMYQDRFPVVAGGLMAYGTNSAYLLPRAASFVDRILRGAKVSELPIEFPTKFELVVNMRTAKALGIELPERLLATADELIK